MSQSTLPLLLEIGCEEIPAGVVPVAAEALLQQVTQALDAAGIEHGPARWLGTPRRLALLIDTVAGQQPDREEVLTGPPLKAGRAADGSWTQAALGFARGHGLDVSALMEMDTAKGPYVAAKKTTAGRPTAQVLADLLPGILRNLPFPKKMRWGREREPFIRPIHWLVALLGTEVMDFTFAGVQSGRSSRGHRFYANRAFDVLAAPGAYELALLDAWVMVDPAARRHAILRGIERLAIEAGGVWVEDQATLDTVVQLTEWPAPLLGEFDAAYLAIPAPVIRTTLRENQKLFTLTGPDGQLLNRFIAVANTLSEQSRAMIARGNARVVSARLSDARFFVQEDCKQALEAYLPRLGDRIYLQGLGSTEQRVGRILALAGEIAHVLCPADKERVERAALLCKCDLATRMVFEFPELQGFVGADYARRGGEQPEVVQAIAQHYQPRFAGDAIPADAIAACVALADKSEAIVGCFAMGLVPTGTQDPYALRRQAVGILRILAEGGHDIALSQLVGMTLEIVRPAMPAHTSAADTLDADVLRFLRGRLAALLQADFPVDLVEAVLDAGHDRVTTVRPRLQALNDLRQRADFASLAIAFKRVANIVRKSGAEVPAGHAVDVALLQEPAERRLYDEVAGVAARIDQGLAQGRYDEALAQLVAIKPAVDSFFDGVMVMTEDVGLRHNRLALLRTCAGLFAPLADFARIQA